MSSSFFRATSLLIGTIIGVGVFGIPYVTAQSGYLVGLSWLIALTILTILIKLAYARVILSFDDDHPHQLTGYGEHYFGRAGKWAAAVVLLVGHWGAVIAYIASMGQFLAIALGRPAWAFWFSVVVFAVGTLVILQGLRTITEIEGVVTLLMVGMVGLLGMVGLGKIDVANLLPHNASRVTYNDLLLPYGVVFGALSGATVLPEVATILNPSGLKVEREALKRSLSRVVLVGVLTAALVYGVFQFTVVGISGIETSEEAIAGLVPYFSPALIKAGALFGLLAMGTSFLTLAYVLRDMFEFDFKLRPTTSVFLTMLPPFGIFLLGLRSFITAFEFTGAWIGTLSMLFIFALYLKARVVQSPHV